MADGMDKKEFGEMAEYADAVFRRARALDELAGHQETRMSAFEGQVYSARKRLTGVSSSLKDDVMGIKQEVASAKAAILDSIAQMKSSVKKDDFARIEKKAESWNPQGLATKEDYKKLISRLQ